MEKKKFINVNGWIYDPDIDMWSRGTYVVSKTGDGLRAWMAYKSRYVAIGTSYSQNVPSFLERVGNFIELKEMFYA